uniref:Reticulon n=1 Tax=Heligmosomoides polygyrus TaxID=6339 RepID=A0A183FSD7_HELPZ
LLLLLVETNHSILAKLSAHPIDHSILKHLCSVLVLLVLYSYFQDSLVLSLTQLIFVPLIIIVSVVCYILIRRHFHRSSGYSENVKRMQARFSTSIYLQVFLKALERK